MPGRADELLAQLEQISARLEAIPPDDVGSLSAALDERSAAILELRDLVAQVPPEALPPDLLARLRNQLAASAAVARKLLLLRAAARAELARLLEAGFLTRSLARGARPSNVDCRG